MKEFRMTGFTGFLKVRHGVEDESMLKAIAAVEQLLFNVETWGEARASKMSEFLEMVGLDIPEEDIELYYRTYSIPVYINERMGSLSLLFVLRKRMLRRHGMGFSEIRLLP